MFRIRRRITSTSDTPGFIAPARLLAHAVNLAIAVTMAGCATVQVTKINENNVDKAKGFRYYLPRPYVAVKQPFPIAGDERFLWGALSADGTVVSIDERELPLELLNYFPSRTEGRVTVPWSQIHAAAPSSTGNVAQSEGDGGGDGKKDDEASKNGDKVDKAAGGASVTTTTDPKSSPILVMNDLYDIVYLPDFTEQYSVRVKARLQKGSADMQLKNGWMLEQVKTEVDNTQIAEFIFENVNKLTDLAAAVAKVRLIPPAPAMPKIEPKLGEGETPDENVAEKEGAGEGATRWVLLRVRFIVDALPGVYPILKPGEEAVAAHAAGPGVTRDYVKVPNMPFVVNAYQVRRAAVVELVNTTVAAAGATPASPKAAAEAPEARLNSVKDALDANFAVDLKRKYAGSTITVVEAMLVGGVPKIVIAIENPPSNADDLRQDIKAMVESACKAKNFDVPNIEYKK